MIREILQLRKAWRWGARKLHELLLEAYPAAEVPATATITESWCAMAASATAGAPGPSAPRPAADADHGPNVVWSVTSRASSAGNGHYCYPLTVQDAYSAISSPARGSKARCCSRPSRSSSGSSVPTGSPARIRSDNGQPFASCALGRLSQLSVWWLRLGIRPELIEPASPHQNGRHERMHKDLKAETTRPAAPSLGAQQRRFDAFRRTFNEVRPHEALDQRRPAALYAPSDRLYVPRLRPITYPEHFEIRRVSTNGGIRWNKRWVNVSHILATLPVGLEPLASGTWNVFFGPVHLGWLDERDYRIHDRRGRAVRERHLSPIR